GFELAHEAMIPAIHRLAGNTQPEFEDARDLLEQRVSEWTRNGRANRFLLSPVELWQLRRFKDLPAQLSRPADASELLAKSKRQWIRRGVVTVAAAGLLALAGGFWARHDREERLKADARAWSQQITTADINKALDLVQELHFDRDLQPLRPRVISN